MIMVMVRINLGSPIFFIQERTSLKQKRFKLIKFRTMTNETDSEGVLLPDEKRQTKFGSFLRSTSLDELPELICIIKGDMSVIGPRPLPPEYNKYYTKKELQRFTVRGGLIPPDSIDRSAVISWDRQLEYEADYAATLSLKNDLIILLNVFRIIFLRERLSYGSVVRKPLNEEREINDD